MHSQGMLSLPVTVIIPVHNRTSPCLTALESVYGQTRPPCQVIVVDDGSTADIEPLRNYLGAKGGELLTQAHRGVAAARNTGIRHATQPWICFLDSDDTWLADKLVRQFELHQREPSLRISQTAERWFRNGVEVRQREHQRPANGPCFDRLVRTCCISASAVMIDRRTLLDAGGFDTSFPVCEDHDLWLRLAHSLKVGLVDEPLTIKNRGLGDHLSEAFPAIDQYRVKALEKALSLPLSPEERELVRTVMDQKISVLEQGAQKRQLTEELQSLRAIRALHGIYSAAPATG